MRRPVPGRYVKVTTASEPFQAFVPAPLPPEPAVVWSSALRKRFDAALVALETAFRLERDVLSRGPVDLLFVEAAVNDASNMPGRPELMLRGMEGVVRQARRVNPRTDIVHLHFVMPEDAKAKGLPRPNDPSVSLREVPRHRMATVRFSGFTTDASITEQTQRLRDWLATYLNPVTARCGVSSVSRVV